LIVGNVIDFELTRVDVAQHQLGRAGGVHRGNASELPIQPDRAQEGGAGELVVVDVVDFQPAGIAVAQQEVGFAGDAAEIPDPREPPIDPDRADKMS
jgi:hypothetical protein